MVGDIEYTTICLLEHVRDREDNTSSGQQHGSLGASSIALGGVCCSVTRGGCASSSGGGGGDRLGDGGGTGSSTGGGDDSSRSGGSNGSSSRDRDRSSRIRERNCGIVRVLTQAAHALGDGNAQCVADIEVGTIRPQFIVPLEEISKGDTVVGSEAGTTSLAVVSYRKQSVKERSIRKRFCMLDALNTRERNVHACMRVWVVNVRETTTDFVHSLTGIGTTAMA